MSDQETGSQWSHILGRAMAGKLQGKSLTLLPAKMTTWQDWKEQHPQTTVTMLKPTAQTFTKDMLERGEAFCLGLVHQGKARYWRFDSLAEVGIVNDQWMDLELVAYFDPQHATAVLWNRATPQGTLTFESTHVGIVDQQTKSTWDLRRGLAIAGELKGQRLTATRAILSFCNAWTRFHPQTTRWEP